MNIIQRIIKYIFFSKDQKYLLELVNHGYLYDHGFVKSKVVGEVVFQDGSPAPWLSYPFLDFFLPKLDFSISLFEYGMGNSTLHYNTIIDHHFGIEHDAIWFEKLMERNLTRKSFKLVSEEEFVKSIALFERRFQLIIIDGIKRNECLKFCVDFLEPDGVIVLDDSERPQYSEEIDKLKQSGFKGLDFKGMKAFGRHASCTSLYYRENNWLNI